MARHMTTDVHQTAITGIIGFVGSVMLAIPAYIETIETVIRFSSLCLSMSVAILTIVKLSKEFKNGRRQKRKA
jgi:hypothetical protein